MEERAVDSPVDKHTGDVNHIGRGVNPASTDQLSEPEENHGEARDGIHKIVNRL